MCRLRRTLLGSFLAACAGLWGLQAAVPPNIKIATFHGLQLQPQGSQWGFAHIASSMPDQAEVYGHTSTDFVSETIVVFAERMILTIPFHGWLWLRCLQGSSKGGSQPRPKPPSASRQSRLTLDDAKGPGCGLPYGGKQERK